MLRAFLVTCTFSALTAHAQSPIIGPMPGHVDMLGATIWLQCTGQCNAQLEYWVKEKPDSLLRSETITSEVAKTHAMEFTLDHVVPGRSYGYRVLVDGKTVDVGEPLWFHTQPLWKYRTDPPEFTVAAGSCTYVNEPAYDRPGTPYGGGYGIFNSIAAAKPDLMIWLGDNTYLREPDWGSWPGYLHRYTHTRSLPELQHLLRSTQHYAIWDDHDFGPNDCDGSFIGADMSHKAFDLFWANPTHGLPGVGGNGTSFSYADVDFFLLDDRSFRVPPDVVTAKPTLLGQLQIDRLIQMLKYSDASFKIVALGGQFLNTEAVYETYATYAEERQQLIDRIEMEGITGVIFLTGDRHHSDLSKLELKDGNVLYDLTVSPLTSGVHAKKEDNTLAIPGSYVEQRNFATLTFTGPRKARTMVMVIHDQEGKVLWERIIAAPKKP
ncbi:MAG: alkaline phosphatase family protein [Flavobacteriales bacterium]|nr:alkaline phosphatase family protein [Flavobacteriales bacterium]